MPQKIIKVPFLKDSDIWFKFTSESVLSTSSIDELIVDFNYVRFLDTDDFVILACIIELYFSKGSKILFRGGSKKFNEHLDNIRFKEYWNEGFDREQFTRSYNNTTLCLWKISKQMIYSYSVYARKYFENQLGNKDLIPLSTSLDEVFNNIFDHSESPITGYVITQYRPTSNKLEFSVCDFGIGIPTSVNMALINEGKKVLDDKEAIKQAFELGFTKKSTIQNRGFGLNNILDFTENHNGEVYVVSNHGIYFKKSKEELELIQNDIFLKGTLIKVVLDLNTIYSKGEEDLIFEI